MKKIVVLMLMAIILTGCEEVNTQKVYTPVVDNYPKQFHLIEDGETGILYIDNEFRSGGNTSREYHIYTPYYLENGKLCKYYDGKIVEVGE